MKGQVKAMPREARKLGILQLFAVAIQHGKEAEFTQYDIAAKLNLTPGGHLTGILKEMVEEGRLVVRTDQWRKNAIRHLYSLKPGTFKTPEDYKKENDARKDRQRTIKLNGQMELFT